MIQVGDVIQVIGVTQKKNNYLIGRVGQVTYLPKVPSEGNMCEVRIYNKRGKVQKIPMLYKNIKLKISSNVLLLDKLRRRI